MKCHSFGFSEAGKSRTHNEDRFLRNQGLGLFVVADGMGGEASGERASGLAVKYVEKFVTLSRSKDFKWPMKLRPDLTTDQNRLLGGVLTANRRIRELARKDASLKGMGTTFVGGILEQDHFAVINVGDSRLYRVRENEIRQITRDHSLVGEKKRRGMLTEKEAKTHPQKHILTSALGASEKPKIDFYRPGILPEDVFLLCSDGVHNPLTDDEILSAICAIEDGSLYKIGLSLVLKAKLAGGLDDMTVLLMSFDREEKKES
jgi:protein phosphatase